MQHPYKEVFLVKFWSLANKFVTVRFSGYVANAISRVGLTAVEGKDATV